MAVTEYQTPPTIPIAIGMQRVAWRDTFGALKLRNYRLYVIAQFIVITAGWAQRIAVDWLVLELTGSIALVGLTIALQFLPTLVLGAYAGVVADRFRKRNVLLFCQASVGVLSLVLAIVAIFGDPQLWFVYLLVIGIGVLQVFDMPARSVFVNEMVGPRHLRNAISVNAAIFHAGALIGPAISGILIVAVGSGWAIAANVVAIIVGIVMLLAIRTGELLVAPSAPKSKGQIGEAARYIRGKPTLFWTMVLVGFVAVFGMPMPVILAGMADGIYATGATGYGLYNSLVAIGALVGALASTRRATLRLRSIVIGVVIYGVVQASAGLMPTYGMFLSVLPLIGLARLLYMTAGETMVQLSSNLAIRGRVMAFYVLVVVGGQAIGGPLLGWLAENAGVNMAMVISGGVPAVAAVVIAVILGHNGRLRLKVTSRRGSWVAIVPRPKRPAA